MFKLTPKEEYELADKLLAALKELQEYDPLSEKTLSDTAQTMIKEGFF